MRFIFEENFAQMMLFSEALRKRKELSLIVFGQAFVKVKNARIDCVFASPCMRRRIDVHDQG